MTIYLTQGRYTEQAIKGMIAKPEDRAVEVAKLVAAGGGKMLAYYVTFGEYDFLAVLESDDNVKAIGTLLAAAASGGVTDLRTTVAVTSVDARQAMAHASDLGKAFRAAGS